MNRQLNSEKLHLMMSLKESVEFKEAKVRKRRGIVNSKKSEEFETESPDGFCGDTLLQGALEGFQNGAAKAFWFLLGENQGLENDSKKESQDPTPISIQSSISSFRRPTLEASLSTVSALSDMISSRRASFEVSVTHMLSCSPVKATEPEVTTILDGNDWKLKFSGHWNRISQKNLKELLEFQDIVPIRAEDTARKGHKFSIKLSGDGNTKIVFRLYDDDGDPGDPIEYTLGSRSVGSRIQGRYVYDKLWWNDDTKMLEHKREDPDHGHEGGFKIYTFRCLLDDNTMASKTVMIRNCDRASITAETLHVRQSQRKSSGWGGRDWTKEEKKALARERQEREREESIARASLQSTPSTASLFSTSFSRKR